MPTASTAPSDLWDHLLQSASDRLDIRFHTTTLYNSIFRFDDEMIVNNHVYGVPGAHAPAPHLRKLGAGDLFDTYARSFVDVWTLSKSATW